MIKVKYIFLIFSIVLNFINTTNCMTTSVKNRSTKTLGSSLFSSIYNRLKGAVFPQKSSSGNFSNGHAGASFSNSSRNQFSHDAQKKINHTNFSQGNNEINSNAFSSSSFSRSFSTKKEINQKEAYEIFKIDPTWKFNLKDVKDIRNHLLNLYHPDKNLDLLHESTIITSKINESYSIIKTGREMLNINFPGLGEEIFKEIIHRLNESYKNWRRNIIFQKEEKKRNEEKFDKEKVERERKLRNAKIFGATSATLAAAYYLYDQHEKENFIKAVKENNTEVVKKYIENTDFDINFEIEGDGCTPLVWAAFYGNENLVKAFLDSNRLKQREQQIAMALFNAVKNGHAELTRFLANHPYLKFNYVDDYISLKRIMSATQPTDNPQIYNILIDALENKIKNIIDVHSSVKSHELADLWEHYISNSTANGSSSFKEEPFYINNISKDTYWNYRNRIFTDILINHFTGDEVQKILEKAIICSDFEMVILIFLKGNNIKTVYYKSEFNKLDINEDWTIYELSLDAAARNVQMLLLLRKYGIKGDNNLLKIAMYYKDRDPELIRELVKQYGAYEESGSNPWHNLANSCNDQDPKKAKLKMEYYYPRAKHTINNLSTQLKKKPSELCKQYSDPFCQNLSKVFKELEDKEEKQRLQQQKEKDSKEKK